MSKNWWGANSKNGGDAGQPPDGIPAGGPHVGVGANGAGANPPKPVSYTPARTSPRYQGNLYRVQRAGPFLLAKEPMTTRLMGPSPQIVLTPEAIKTIWRLVDKVDLEVGWMGHAVKQVDGSILIDRIFLFEQEVSSSTTVLDPQSLTKIVEELVMNNQEDVASHLHFWGHSHVNMETYPSPQDDRQMEEFGLSGAPFMVRGIFNKKGSARWDMWDYERQLVHYSVPWVVAAPFEESEFAALDREISQKVRTRSWGNWTGYGQGYEQVSDWGGPADQPHVSGIAGAIGNTVKAIVDTVFTGGGVVPGPTDPPPQASNPTLEPPPNMRGNDEQKFVD